MKSHLSTRGLVKCLMPFISFFVILGITLSLGYVERDAISALLPILYLAVTVAVSLWLKVVYPRIFPASQSYSWKIPDITTMAGLLLLIPLLQSVIQWGLIYLKGIDSFVFCHPSESVWEILSISVVSVFIAPILEEMFYRFMSISPFSTTRGKVYGLLLTSVLFGLSHMYNPLNGLVTFVMGLIYGGIFLWKKNIWYSSVFHMGCNLWVSAVWIIMAFDVPMIGTDITGDGAVYIGWPWMIVNAVVGAIGLLLLNKKRFPIYIMSQNHSID